MSESLPEESSCPVVLLAEDVDRNALLLLPPLPVHVVVLLAEDVDRNVSAATSGQTGHGRPPCGGRG